MISFKEYVNEMESRFSDSAENTPEIQEVNQDLIFELDGKKLEFKPENEVKENGDIYFTYEEALALQKDGWRLLTKEEFDALCEYPFEFKGRQGIIDNRLCLSVMGFRSCSGKTCDVGSYGYYWSSTPEGSEDAWYLEFNSYEMEMEMHIGYQCFGQTVRLVREI